jgi:hypothetical protein
LRSRLGHALVVAALAGLPRPAAAQPAELLPDASLRLSAARYLPAERDFQWTAWIGGGIGALRVGRVTLFGCADVETVIGSERRGFDANQANYYLETGVRATLGRRSASLFFNHVSRHTQDRAKPQAVDWNVLGVRLAGPLSDSPFPTRFAVSAGHTTLASSIGYRFEAVLRLEADLVTRPWGGLFVDGEVRGVTAESSPRFPRSGFVDARGEGGIRFRRGPRSAEVFLAYEHRNDVYVTQPGSRTRGLLGLRLGLDDAP